MTTGTRKPIVVSAQALEDLALRVQLDLTRPPRQPTEEVVQMESSFRAFVEQAWKITEPSSPLVGGMHLDAVCEHLQAVYDGAIQKLLITIPPRHGKSTIASVLFPAWVWLHDPSARFVYASYALSLSVRDSVRCRRLVRSHWYQSRWGDAVRLVDDQNMKMRFETTKGGHRIATSVDGAVTGEGGRFLVADDPHNVKEAESELLREAVIDWWDQAMSTRGDNPEQAAWVIIQQRVHDRDLAGHVLEQGGYEHLNLPAEYERDYPSPPTAIGWTDPRTEDGALLWPERWTHAQLDQLKTVLGSRAASAQLQQRPAPLGGDIFKTEWWKFYWRLPERFDEQWQSWDCTFKDESDSDYVVGQVWGRIGHFAFLIDQVREQLSFTGTLAAIERLRAQYPGAYRILIEDKANGPAVLNALAAKVGGPAPTR
jgi:hypothetical protein